MGRKIPGRKHHGVRDPIKQNAKRLHSLKSKINAPPTAADEDFIPKSVQRLRELRDKVKNNDLTRKKVKRPKPTPMFQKLPHENNRQFFNRMNDVCQQVKKEAAFENKYRVEIKRDESGEVVDVVKRGKDPIEVMLKEARKKKKEKKVKNKKSLAEEENTVKLTKSQKRRQKQLEKKRQKEEENGGKDFSSFIDTVRFGEQVHAPPQLVRPRKVHSSNTAPRPGERGLLLKTILNPQISSNDTKPSKIHNKKESNKLGKTNKKVIDRTGKRKTLPHALRRQLEKHQKEAMEAYKANKSKKL